MKKEIAERWAKALESGEYQQTKGYMKDSEGYCCLGVLTDLYCKENTKCFDDFFVGDFEFETADLPTPVQEWADIEINPSIQSYGIKIDLSDLNDEGVTFKEIAALIRKEYLGQEVQSEN